MSKAINKSLYILLIILVIFLVLNQFYVIQFSEDLKNVFMFLTLIIILLTSVKEIIISKSGFIKFLSCVTLFCIIVGGIGSVISKQINLFIYLCLLFSLLHGFVELVYSKS